MFKDHTSNAQRALRSEDESATWLYKEHSIQKVTNAFGDIEFVGYGGNVGKVCIHE